MNTPTKIAYADCFSGVSGDMFLGAILHCGLPETILREELSKLNIDGFEISISTATVCGIGACKVDVHGEPQKHYRHLSSIRKIIDDSHLADFIKDQSIEVFSELARAEAKVHNIEIEQVHFHEVGAIDTIIDIVGSLAGLYHLGVEKLYTSPVPSPRGFVKCAHGKLPLPAPAVCEILHDVPCYGVEIENELVTPTGAALLKVLTTKFGSMPPMTIRSTGYGAGSATLPGDQPNLFRLIIGDQEKVDEHQQVEIIETNLDDWNPEGFPYLCNMLFSKGALDVTLAPIQMKKGRPGFKLQIISPPHLGQELRAVLFTETTCIGLRFRKESRQTLPRKIVEINTPWGKLAAKQVVTPNGVIIYPEYEECLRVAEANNIPLMQVYSYVRGEVNSQ